MQAAMQSKQRSMPLCQPTGSIDINRALNKAAKAPSVSVEARRRAVAFIEKERQFHLGFLPTEQSHPKTVNLDAVFRQSPACGVRLLQAVDRDILVMAQRLFRGREFREMVEAGVDALLHGRRIILSGCGATGRLSVLLESMWRRYFRELKRRDESSYRQFARFANSVRSIITGGDYALIRSVESFEDYAEFGRQQVRELAVMTGDVLIAITEGGETSSVLGAVQEAVGRRARVFLLFNNPASLLAKKLERSRRAILNPAVTVLDLFCGPMAVAGSTRMQATTAEQLIAGAALETILDRLTKAGSKKQSSLPAMDYAAGLEKMLDDLAKPAAVKALAEYIEFEEKLYRHGGLVTYYADDYMLDIFTDTTERAPTFMLPPFRKRDDRLSAPSWAFVKSPRLTTAQGWRHILGRPLRCLNWNGRLYRHLGAPPGMIDSPPVINRDAMLKFNIGRDSDSSRCNGENCAAVKFFAASESAQEGFVEFEKAFDRIARSYPRRASLCIGSGPISRRGDRFVVPLITAPSPLMVFEHLAVKLALNIISTGTMVRLGRITGNWMSYVEVTNKKLIDRGIRIISNLCGLSYLDAAHALFQTIVALEPRPHHERKQLSPVRQTILRLGRKHPVKES